MIDTGRFYHNGKGAQIFIGKDFASKLKFKNRDKLVIEYDEKKNEMIIKLLNP